MNVAVQLGPPLETPPAVTYRWDADTDILTAQVHGAAEGTGLTGSVDLEGADGSWVVLEFAHGSLRGVEVAVWPDVRQKNGLTPPAQAENARLTIPARASEPGLDALEVDAALVAESDAAEQVIHFRIGNVRAARTVRVAKDLLLDLDGRQRIAGLWLLNVPRSPSSAPLP